MNKFVLAALLLLSLSAAWGQKIEVKKDLILVDGQPYARIEADGCGVLDVQCMYYVKALTGEQRLFVVKQLEYADPAERDASDPTGRVLYLQFVFTAAATAAETAYPLTLHLRPIDVARKVVKARLMKDGVLDAQAATDFVTNNGSPFSERRKALSGPTTIIITH